jgi:hypothetical protein
VGRAPASFDPDRRPSGERVVRFDSASLSEDGRLLKMSFVGSKTYDPANPCTAEYAGWAQISGDVLEAAVVDITPPYSEPFAYECTAEGYDREVTVTLPGPYLGVTVKDLAGAIHTLSGPSLGEGAPTEPPLHDCGVETATGPNGPWNVEARECFWGPYLQGTPAQFTSTRPTVEGDPITTVFRVYGPGNVEVVEDTTRDRFGAQVVTLYSCSGLTPLPQSSVQPDFAIRADCQAAMIGTTPLEASVPPTASQSPSTPAPEPLPSPPAGGGDWGSLAVIGPQDGADTARMEGTLRVTDDCVQVLEQGEPVLLVWPSGQTSWDPGTRSITFVNADGTTVTVGDGSTVVLGGSGMSRDEDGELVDTWLAGMRWVAPPAAGCTADRYWTVGEIAPG